MESIDPRRLRALQQIAARGSISAAAEALNFSPSAVSQQMAALEKDVGAALLDRNGRGVALTDAGHALLKEGVAALDALDRARAAVEQTLARVAGTVRISSFESFAHAALPAAILLLQERHSQLTVESVGLEPDAAVQALALHEIDLGLVIEYDHHPINFGGAVDTRLVAEEALVLTVPESWDLPSQPLRRPAESVSALWSISPESGGLDLAELSGRPWVSAPLSTGCGAAYYAALRSSGFEPDLRYFTDFPGIALNFVAKGLAAAIVPEVSLRSLPEGVRVIPMDQPLGRRTVAAIRSGSGDRPAISATLTALRDAAGATLGREPVSSAQSE